MAAGRGAVEDLDLKALFGGVYAGRRVLVTGHSGFKGSWLVLWLRALGARVAGLSLAPADGPSHHLLLGGADGPWTDLRDARAVDAALHAFAPEIVFHLAAQPLVRASYRDPVDTFATNVTGLIHLLEAVRRCGSVRAVVNATTDKCYRNDEPSAGGPGRPGPQGIAGFGEDDPLGGHDPYSASKACAEIVSACWRASFLGARDGAPPVALATARAGNVIGGGDWSEDRLVPDLVRAAIAGTPCRLRNPASVRPWQHVLEPLAGYLALGRALLESPATVAGAYNFGPSSEGHATVGEVVSGFAAHWPALRVERDAGPHPHEAAVLRLDCTRARAGLGWRPVWDTATTLARTARWYRRWHEQGAVDSAADLHAYVADARAAGLAWTGSPSRAPVAA